MHPLARLILIRSLPLALLLGAMAFGIQRMAVAAAGLTNDVSVTVAPTDEWLGPTQFGFGGFVLLAVLEALIFVATGKRKKPVG